jgi:hypothetical protein
MACNDGNMPEEDTQAPRIAILSPAAAAVFEPGSEIIVEVDFEENQEMHTLNGVLRSMSDKKAITLFDEHVHAQDHTVRMSYTLPQRSGETFVLTVKANDHNDNQNSAAVTFFTH